MENKTLPKLRRFLRETDISYNELMKKRFQSLSVQFLKELRDDLEFKESEVRFNKGGVAVSGEASLYGMWGPGTGICLYIQQSCTGRSADFMYRPITRMGDYVGGHNNYVRYNESYDDILEDLKKLKKGDSQDEKDS